MNREIHAFCIKNPLFKVFVSLNRRYISLLKISSGLANLPGEIKQKNEKRKNFLLFYENFSIEPVNRSTIFLA